jgi:hypothetical protein
MSLVRVHFAATAATNGTAQRRRRKRRRLIGVRGAGFIPQDSVFVSGLPLSQVGRRFWPALARFVQTSRGWLAEAAARDG